MPRRWSEFLEEPLFDAKTAWVEMSTMDDRGHSQGHHSLTLLSLHA